MTAPRVVIATRFNVKFNEERYERDKSGGVTQTPEWLNERFRLFEQVCLPSIMLQDDQELVWLVFFSDETPPEFVQRIERISERYDRFVPIYLRTGEFMAGRFRVEVAALVRPDESHVITARIDNDDAFHRSMVRRIRSEFRGQADEFLNFLDGVQYDPSSGLTVGIQKPCNPFMARIEELGEGPPRTVLEVQHTEAWRTGRLRDIRSNPMWLQLIHRGNVTNRFGSGRILFKVDLKAEFGSIDPIRMDHSAAMQYWLRDRLVVRPRSFMARMKQVLRSSE